MEENKNTEKMSGVIRAIKIILFIVFLAMIVWGQKTVGYTNLMMMLVGLSGLIILLYLYNKKYQ